MRRWLVVAIAACLSWHVQAAEPVAEDAVSLVDAATTSADVTITPIPMPAQVTELLSPINPAAKLRAAKKLKLAKKKEFPQILLTRTERHQLALLVEASKTDGLHLHIIIPDDDGPGGYDDLALHQFYSRPRLVVDDEDDDEHDEPALVGISDTARVRLLMARLKALEAHALASVPDDGQPLAESVSQRLAAARQKAVEAHQKKFS